MLHSDRLFSELAGSLMVLESHLDLDELPEGSIIYAEVVDRDGGFWLVKDLSEKLYLGSPCEWYTFVTRGGEILLMEEVFPALPPVFLVMRGESPTT